MIDIFELNYYCDFQKQKSIICVNMTCFHKSQMIYFVPTKEKRNKSYLSSTSVDWLINIFLCALVLVGCTLCGGHQKDTLPPVGWLTFNTVHQPLSSKYQYQRNQEFLSGVPSKCLGPMLFSLSVWMETGVSKMAAGYRTKLKKIIIFQRNFKPESFTLILN